MANVYISSTLDDLRREREAVRDAILRLGHQPLDSYTARDLRPLDACLDDIGRCRAYVGILGWRYGSSPPGERRSYTELEFEHAGLQDVPRLVFLRRETATALAEADRDTTAVRAFRERVASGRIVAPFATENELIVAVEDALRREVGTGEPVPRELPWMADRSRQQEEFEIAVAHWRDAPRHPLVCILHGDEYEGLSELEDRLRRSLERLPPTAGEPCPATRHDLEWPRSFRDRDDFRAKLLAKLARELLDDPTAGADEVERALARFPGPVTPSTQILTDDYRERGAELLDAFLAFWRGFEAESTGRKLVVFLRVKYQVKRDRPWLRRWRYASHNRRLAEHLDRMVRAPDLAVLPRLEPVGRSEVESWADLDEVRERLRGRSLEPAIRALFAGWERERGEERIPMEELAGMLRTLLYEHDYLRQEAA